MFCRNPRNRQSPFLPGAIGKIVHLHSILLSAWVPLAAPIRLCYGKQVLHRVISSLVIAAVVAVCAETTAANGRGHDDRLLLAAKSAPLAFGHATRTDSQAGRLVRSLPPLMIAPWILPAIVNALPILSPARCHRNDASIFQPNSGFLITRKIRGPPHHKGIWKTL